MVCSETATFDSTRNAFVQQEWNHVFSGNRTCMKVVGLERMPDIALLPWPSTVYRLSNVSKLDVTVNPLSTNGTIQDVQIMAP